MLVARKKNEGEAADDRDTLSGERINAQRAHLEGQIDRQRAEFEESRRALERDLTQTQTLVREKQTEIEAAEERCRQTLDLLQQRENLLQEIKTRPWRVLWHHLGSGLSEFSTA